VFISPKRVARTQHFSVCKLIVVATLITVVVRTRRDGRESVSG
jgi:hypothetical protein